MNLQEILTYLIIAVASGSVLLSLYKTLFPSKDKVNQNGCAGACNCDAKVMSKELLSKRKDFGASMKYGK
jgi:hypothetical protein